MKEVTVIVDMQNDFCTGALENPNATNVIPNICDEITVGKLENRKFIATQDTSDPETYLETIEGKNLPILHTVEGTAGWEIVKEIKELLPEDTIFVRKHTLGYPGSKWKEVFKKMGINDDEEFVIYLAGTLTGMCVLTNAIILMAEFPNAHIRVIRNCCADLTTERHEAALKAMSTIFIEIV